MKSSVKISSVVLGGLVVVSLWAFSACRRTSSFAVEQSGLEAWYPLYESRPDPDSLAGLRVTLQADWVRESPYGPAVADRINARLLDALCGMIYGDSEVGEDEALVKVTSEPTAVAEAMDAGADESADRMAEPTLGQSLADAILSRYPLEKAGFNDWMQALVARYLSEYRQDLAGFAAEIASGRFSPNAVAYEMECNQLLEVGEGDTLVWKTFLYVYTGGAHGMQSVQYLNIDAKTGAEITLDDLLKPEMRDMVRDRIREKLSQSAYGNDLFDLMAVELPDQFRLGGDSIVFQYQVYEIAPYVSGPIAVSLTKAELADCLR